MSAEPQRVWTAEEYLAFDRRHEGKHELLDGDILAMSGASRAHGRISWNVAGSLYPQLEKQGCEGFVGDMRVRVPVTDRYTYPDLVVVCGEPRFEDAELDTLLNPSLIVEILSPSTEERDRGTKLFHYRSIPSLRVILLIAQDKIHIEQFLRQDDGTWILSDTDDRDSVLELSAIGSRLTVADIYHRVPGI